MQQRQAEIAEKRRRLQELKKSREQRNSSTNSRLSTGPGLDVGGFALVVNEMEMR
jgi:hypothetical protein